MALAPVCDDIVESEAARGQCQMDHANLDPSGSSVSGATSTFCHTVWGEHSQHRTANEVSRLIEAMARPAIPDSITGGRAAAIIRHTAAR
jgi:hypothetical protein